MSGIEQVLEMVLQKIKSGNPNLLREAEIQTKKWESENFAGYLFGLCSYICNPTKENHNRFLAGILFRGTLQAKEAQSSQQKQQQWLQGVPDDLKAKIKEGFLKTLGTDELKARQICAQIISTIALVELPHGRWQELITILSNNVTNPQIHPNLKQASLETLGYILEEISTDVLASSSDKVLTAIVHGMRPEEANVMVKRSAIIALQNALSFCRPNFENPQERDVLMKVILDSSIHPDEEVRVSAFGILVEIATIHYEKISPYMQRIFKHTLEAIKAGQPEEVVKQAIEFWSTICEEEYAIREETDYARESNYPPPSRRSSFFIKGALQFLVPIIAETLTKQDENFDPDDWTVSMAGGICLQLIAQTVEDEVIPHIMPFIERNITSQDWRFREAAVLAFGSILEGPHQIIGQLVSQATPLLLQHMRDPKTAVKDTTAWTFTKILKLHHKSVLGHAEDILKVMGEALSDKPRVASHAASAIHFFAESFKYENINPLAKYFNEVVQLLLVTSERNDADEDNLRIAAYEALNIVLAAAPPNAIASLEQLVSVVLERLEKSFYLDVNDDLSKQNELQGLLCGVLQVITQKIQERIKPYADRVMTLLIRLFKAKSNSAVHEEAFLTVAALSNAVEGEFVKYMPQFQEQLYMGLNNWQEHQVCSNAVGVVVDVSRAIGGNLLPYCDQIITFLLQDLQNRNLDRAVKPPILACFGDIALAIGGSFQKYLEVVMGMLKQASETVIKTQFFDSEDYDLIEYMNLLREAIFTAFTGIIQGLKGDGKGELIAPHVSAILQLVAHVAADTRRSDSVANCAVGICGDLALAIGARIKQTLLQPFVQQLITTTHSRAEEIETKETAEWARNVIQSL